FGNVFGSLVVELRVRVALDFLLQFQIALAYPEGPPPNPRMTLRTIASLALDLAVTVDAQGSRLNLGFGASLRVQLGPKRIRPLAIRPKFADALSLLSDQ